MWRNHHAITILNFLVAQIAAMNLKFDSILIHQEIAIDTVMKKALTALLPLFQRADCTMPLSFSRFPASLLAYTVFLSDKS